MKYKISLEGDSNEDDITALFEDLVRSLYIIGADNSVVTGSLINQLTNGTQTIDAKDVDLDEDMSGPDVEPEDN